jgi:uncharacterized protein (DUF433 family)
MYICPMSARDLITVDPEIMGGTAVFEGTRVPVKAPFDYLADSLSIDYFLDTFPSVPRESAIAIITRAQESLTA